ncbi:uncharacterized protein LOC128221243 [Mya arenaria]|uniref:uncharacterized protein LOC128221243 n=1 Tax=Mya arenaria TaxID=6604 RepID=UPI0022E2EE0E|nr:uncharacterized protein LOC128221243 [Mya arenaria]
MSAGEGFRKGHSEFHPKELNHADLTTPREGVEERPRTSVPILGVPYDVFCSALFFLLEDWVQNKLPDKPPADLRQWEKDAFLKVNKLNSEGIHGDINDQVEEVKYTYRKLIELKVLCHFRIVATHRIWLRKVYKLCLEIGIQFPENVESLVNKHDFSKYTHKEVLGYAIMFQDGNLDFRELTLDDEKVEWKNTLYNHYAHNPHHPEYFYPEDTQTGVREKTKPIRELDSEDGLCYLLESILDMLASRGERFLKDDPVISLQKLFEMPRRYLQRYHESDQDFVEETMQEWSNIAQEYLAKEENREKLNGMFDNRRKVTYDFPDTS